MNYRPQTLPLRQRMLPYSPAYREKLKMVALELAA